MFERLVADAQRRPNTGTIELQGKMVSCPRDSDAYLQTVYGNYMEVDYTYVDNEVAHSRKGVDEASDR